MKKVLLNIDEKPLLYSKQNLAFQLSVLQSCGKDIMPWLIGKFTNLVYNSASCWQFDLCKDDLWFAKEKVFIKSHFLFNTKLTFANLDILQLVRDYLDDGQYITGDFDTYYIASKPGYQKYHQMQDYLIYGYCDVSKELFCFGYTAPFTYGLYTISYSEYMAAICGRLDNRFNINAVKLNSKFQFEYTAASIYNGTYNFLNSTNQNTTYTTRNSCEYGVKCFDNLKTHLSNTGLYYEYIDRRNYLVIQDFEMMLIARMRYLIAKNTISKKHLATTTDLDSLTNEFVTQCKLYNEIKSTICLENVLAYFDKISSINIKFAEIICSALKQHCASG